MRRRKSNLLGAIRGETTRSTSTARIGQKQTLMTRREVLHIKHGKKNSGNLHRKCQIFQNNENSTPKPLNRNSLPQNLSEVCDIWTFVWFSSFVDQVLALI